MFLSISGCTDTGCPKKVSIFIQNLLVGNWAVNRTQRYKLVHLIGPRAFPGSKWKGQIPTADAPIQVVPKKCLFLSKTSLSEIFGLGLRQHPFEASVKVSSKSDLFWLFQRRISVGLVWYGMVWFETTSIWSFCESFIKICLGLVVSEKI